MNKLGLVASALFLWSCVTNSAVPAIDRMDAVLANDYTALIRGCGNQLSDGFIVCRKFEGTAASDMLVFVAPDVKCSGDRPCVAFKVFRPDGSIYGGAIPKGETRKAVSWPVLLNKTSFDRNDRGLWGYSYTIRYNDTNGNERWAYAQGEIYLRVIKQGYIPLHAVSDDENFIWEGMEDGAYFKMTSGMRTFIEKKTHGNPPVSPSSPSLTPESTFPLPIRKDSDTKGASDKTKYAQPSN